jgi:hypothetical protein
VISSRVLRRFFLVTRKRVLVSRSERTLGFPGGGGNSSEGFNVILFDGFADGRASAVDLGRDSSLGSPGIGHPEDIGNLYVG